MNGAKIKDTFRAHTQSFLCSIPAFSTLISLHLVGTPCSLLHFLFPSSSCSPRTPFATAAKGGRPELESALVFGGFALLDSPLKRDSASVVARLQAAACRCAMITGDGALTAAAVARRRERRDV